MPGEVDGGSPGFNENYTNKDAEFRGERFGPYGTSPAHVLSLTFTGLSPAILARGENPQFMKTEIIADKLNIEY